jgi:hypothetical protein
MEDNYLLNISSKLEHIDIDRAIEKENIFNAICGVFLINGNNLFYINDSENDAWIYFKDHRAIAAQFAKLKGEDALQKILNVELGAVNSARQIDVPEEQFSYSLQSFMQLSKTRETKSNPKEFTSLNKIAHCSGYVAYLHKEVIYRHNIIPDSLPLNFLQSLADITPEAQILTCKLQEHKLSNLYSFVKHKDLTWVFKFRKSVIKENILSQIMKALEDLS